MPRSGRRISPAGPGCSPALTGSSTGRRGCLCCSASRAQGRPRLRPSLLWPRLADSTRPPRGLRHAGRCRLPPPILPGGPGRVARCRPAVVGPAGRGGSGVCAGAPGHPGTPPPSPCRPMCGLPCWMRRVGMSAGGRPSRGRRAGSGAQWRWCRCMTRWRGGLTKAVYDADRRVNPARRAGGSRTKSRLRTPIALGYWVIGHAQIRLFCYFRAGPLRPLPGCVAFERGADRGKDAGAVGGGQSVEQREGPADDAIGTGDCSRGAEHDGGFGGLGRVGGQREPAQSQRLGVQRPVVFAGQYRPASRRTYCMFTSRPITGAASIAGW